MLTLLGVGEMHHRLDSCNNAPDRPGGGILRVATANPEQVSMTTLDPRARGGGVPVTARWMTETSLVEYQRALTQSACLTILSPIPTGSSVASRTTSPTTALGMPGIA